MIADVARLGFIRGRVLDPRPTARAPSGIAATPRTSRRTISTRTSPQSSTRTSVRPPGPRVLRHGSPRHSLQNERHAGTGADGRGSMASSEVATRPERLCLLACRAWAEGARVTDDLLLVKVMDQVNGGKVRWMTDVATDVAEPASCGRSTLSFSAVEAASNRTDEASNMPATNTQPCSCSAASEANPVAQGTRNAEPPSRRARRRWPRSGPTIPTPPILAASRRMGAGERRGLLPEPRRRGRSAALQQARLAFCLEFDVTLPNARGLLTARAEASLAGRRPDGP